MFSYVVNSINRLDNKLSFFILQHRLFVTPLTDVNFVFFVFSDPNIVGVWFAARRENLTK